jgi:hypothetical protein
VGDFVANSSGHPACEANEALTKNLMNNKTRTKIVSHKRKTAELRVSYGIDNSAENKAWTDASILKISLPKNQ